MSVATASVAVAGSGLQAGFRIHQPERALHHSEKRALRDGAGDAFAKAFEMIATPALFGLAGWYLDGRLGTFPVLTLALVVVVFAYQVWRFACDYSTRMDAALQARRARYSSTGTGVGNSHSGIVGSSTDNGVGGGRSVVAVNGVTENP